MDHISPNSWVIEQLLVSHKTEIPVSGQGWWLQTAIGQSTKISEPPKQTMLPRHCAYELMNGVLSLADIQIARRAA